MGPMSDEGMPFAILRSALRQAIEPFAKDLGLTKLSEHFDVLVFSALFFWTVQALWSPFVSRAIFRGSYGRLTSARARNNW